MLAFILRRNSLGLVCLIYFLSVGPTTTQADEKVSAEFRRSNPGYVERAGHFYEKDYLPGAIKGLKAVFAPQQLDDATAKRLLIDLIYGFLEQYTADGGNITRRHHAAILAKLDDQIHRIADDPAILTRYKKWKQGSDATYPNPLNFLTIMSRQSPPLKLALSKSLREANWRVNSLESLEDTGRFADVLNREPYQVIRIDRKGDNDGSNQSLVLLLYRLKHAPQLTKELDRLTNERAQNHSPYHAPTLFWRTRTHVIFAQEKRTNNSDHDIPAIKKWVRTQWMQE